MAGGLGPGERAGGRPPDRHGGPGHRHGGSGVTVRRGDAPDRRARRWLKCPAMNTFTAGPRAIAEVERSVRDWVFSDRLAELVAIFGAKIPSSGTRGALAWLDEFSQRNWDFRAGRER